MNKKIKFKGKIIEISEDDYKLLKMIPHTTKGERNPLDNKIGNESLIDTPAPQEKDHLHITINNETTCPECEENTSPQPRMSWEETFDEEFKGKIQIKDRPDGVTVSRLKQFITKLLASERMRVRVEVENIEVPQAWAKTAEYRTGFRNALHATVLKIDDITHALTDEV